MIPSSGLPVCLSGVLILPRARPPHRRIPPLSVGFRMSPSNREASGHPDGPNLASDYHAANIFGSPLPHVALRDQREDECITTDAGNCDYLSNTRRVRASLPRFSIAKEMADLDRRREEIRKQRDLQNAGYFRGEYRLIHEQSGFIWAGFEAQLMLQIQSDYMHHKNFCAKAA